MDGGCRIQWFPFLHHTLDEVIAGTGFGSNEIVHVITVANAASRRDDLTLQMIVLDRDVVDVLRAMPKVIAMRGQSVMRRVQPKCGQGLPLEAKLEDQCETEAKVQAPALVKFRNVFPQRRGAQQTQREGEESPVATGYANRTKSGQMAQ